MKNCRWILGNLLKFWMWSLCDPKSMLPQPFVEYENTLSWRTWSPSLFSEDSIDFQILTHVRNMSISYKKIKIPKNNNSSFQKHLLKRSSQICPLNAANLLWYQGGHPEVNWGRLRLPIQIPAGTQSRISSSTSSQEAPP